MDYCVYKLEFLTGVHFGNGMLNDSEYTLCADTLFSALSIEALKDDKLKTLYDTVKSGKLLFSDAFPYIGKQYFIPKPILHIETKDSGNSIIKKKMKKTKYILADDLDDYLKGSYTGENGDISKLGHSETRTLASVRNDREDTLPYQVGTYHFEAGNGLYVIVGYEDADALALAEELLEALSYTGIGGKKASGLGKFELKKGSNVEKVLSRLRDSGSKKRMNLSISLPTELELDEALVGSSYLLVKRSGFIASEHYAEERKKKDMYLFAAGSCFGVQYSGDVYDVSQGGGHPVYRYAKPIFMGVDV